MDKEKWLEIHYLLFDSIKSGISENDFELNVLRALGVLNWKEYLGEIDVRPSFQIGANNRIIPDFLIKSKEGKNLFVIEIKQPNIPLNSTFQQQLFSYMRQLKLEYGILIGQSIQLFYDGSLNKQETPILLETIKFDRENKRGIEFVNLFDKSNFNFKNLDIFSVKSIKKIDKKNDFNNLTKKITSPEFSTTVDSLIKQHFINDYDGELLDSVLNNIIISISKKNELKPISQITNLIQHNNSKSGVISSIINIISSPHTKEEVLKKLTTLFPERNPEGMRKTINCQLGGKNRPLRIENEQRIQLNIELGQDNQYRYSLINIDSKNQKMKIGQYAQNIFRKYYEDGNLTSEIINNLQNSDYCKRNLNQNFEVLRKTSRDTKDENGRNRYYTKEIFCGNYYLTSQWYEYHREPFNNWLKTILN